MPVYKKPLKTRVNAPVPKKFKSMAKKQTLADGLEMFGFNSYVRYFEALGLAAVWTAYAKFCRDEDIMQIGFNNNSGYVYIALENGVTIASQLGQKVEYIVTDYNSGEEYFLKTYRAALNKLKSLNK
jgi:hypothetical protein